MNSVVDILLVEDNQDDIDLALHALRQGNLANNVFVVRDGEEALEFLFSGGAYANRSLDRPPKLVLLDLKMPKVDGLQVLKEKERSPYASHPGGDHDFVEGRARPGGGVQLRREQLYPEAGGL